MKKKIFFLFFLVLFSLKLFDSIYVREGVLKYITYGYILFGILISLPYFFKYKGGFVLPVQIISVSIVISIFMAYFSWGQSLSYSATTIPYLIWFLFFYLLHSKIPIHKIEKIIIIYGCLYSVLFFFQLINYDKVYFGTRDIVMDRGIMRVIFPGGGVFFLSSFISITKITENNGKQKLFWLVFVLTSVVVVVLQVTRQTIFILLFIYLIHFMRKLKLVHKIVLSLLFILGVYLFFNFESSISRGLIDQQHQDATEGHDYARIREATFFLTKFTPNVVSKIFGNGFFNDTSRYGKTLKSLGDNHGLYLTDVGIVEVYIVFGIFAIVGYVIIFIKSFTIPLPKNKYYLKYYLWMIMLSCFTSDFLISYNFLISTVIVLYCYQRYYKLMNHYKKISL